MATCKSSTHALGVCHQLTDYHMASQAWNIRIYISSNTNYGCGVGEKRLVGVPLAILVGAFKPKNPKLIVVNQDRWSFPLFGLVSKKQLWHAMTWHHPVLLSSPAVMYQVIDAASPVLDRAHFQIVIKLWSNSSSKAVSIAVPSLLFQKIQANQIQITTLRVIQTLSDHTGAKTRPSTWWGGLHALQTPCVSWRGNLLKSFYGRGMLRIYTRSTWWTCNWSW